MSEISGANFSAAARSVGIYSRKTCHQKMYSACGVLMDINKLKGEHRVYMYLYYDVQTSGRSAIQDFFFPPLLPVSWSAFPSPADQSRYSRSAKYCTQILLEGYIISSTPSIDVLCISLWSFFFSCFIYKKKNHNNISFREKILSSLAHKRQPTSAVLNVISSFHRRVSRILPILR